MVAEIVPGDLDAVVMQFSAEHTLASVLTRWFTHSAFSHVDLVLPDGRLLGARPAGGVQIRPPDYARFYRVLQLLMRTPLAARHYRYALSQVGKPYDWRAVIGFLLPSRDWRDENAWFCSELVAATFDGTRDRLVHLVGRDEPITRVTPNDLLISPRLEGPP